MQNTRPESRTNGDAAEAERRRGRPRGQQWAVEEEAMSLHGIPLLTEEEAVEEGYVSITVPIYRSAGTDAMIRSMASALREPTRTGPRAWTATRAAVVLRMDAKGNQSVEFWRHRSQVLSHAEAEAKDAREGGLHRSLVRRSMFASATRGAEKKGGEQ